MRAQSPPLFVRIAAFSPTGQSLITAPHFLGDFIVLKDFLIERFIPGVELLTAKQYAEVAGKSNAALSQLGAGIEWVSSFIVKDMTFCHYRAQDEEIIREHARISGFPANKISLITNVISPKTAAS
jgi:hypothetical protein